MGTELSTETTLRIPRKCLKSSPMGTEWFKGVTKFVLKFSGKVLKKSKINHFLIIFLVAETVTLKNWQKEYLMVWQNQNQIQMQKTILMINL